MVQNGMECCFTSSTAASRFQHRIASLSVSHVFWDLLTCSRIVLFVHPRIRRQNTGSVHTPVVAWGLACFVLFLHHAESCLCCAEPCEEATGWITTAQEAVAELFNSEVLFAEFCVRSLSQSRRCRSGAVHSALDRVKQVNRSNSSSQRQAPRCSAGLVSFCIGQCQISQIPPSRSQTTDSRYTAIFQEYLRLW
ncbi:hypothetical protein EDC04DRAFT_2701242 [Pisolithus marmoratus]|nr:hypothetical protein EDC04DRAFT_2701242 [Pisolithus marmoratus]